MVAASPRYPSRDEVAQADLDRERAILSEQAAASGKSELQQQRDAEARAMHDVWFAVVMAHAVVRDAGTFLVDALRVTLVAWKRGEKDDEQRPAAPILCPPPAGRVVKVVRK